MEGTDRNVPLSWDLTGPARFVHTQLFLVLLFGLLAFIVYRSFRWFLALLRLREFGSAIPGPKASWLSGNSAQMIDAGGLTFFLEYLHDRSVPAGAISDSTSVTTCLPPCIYSFASVLWNSLMSITGHP